MRNESSYTHPDNGTMPYNLEKAIEEFGYDYESKRRGFNSTDDIPSYDEYKFADYVKDTLRRNLPIIILSNDWAGHYTVIIGYDDMGTDDNGYYWPLNYFGFPVRPVTSVRPNIIGDANGDGNVDESDINAIADYIVKGKTEGLNLKNADANGDQKVNVADIVRIINRIKK